MVHEFVLLLLSGVVDICCAKNARREASQNSLEISPRGDFDRPVQQTKINTQVHREDDSAASGNVGPSNATGAARQIFIRGVPVYNYQMRGYRRDASMIEHSSHLDASVATDWLVTFRDNCTDDDLTSLCALVTCLDRGHPSEGGLGFAAVRATEVEIDAALGDASLNFVVKFIEPDGQFQAFSPLEQLSSLLETSRDATPWNLDRVNQRNNSLDGDTDATANLGAGVHVFVFDTGVRTTHEQFQSRAKQTLCSVCYPMEVCGASDTDCAFDRNGHGTHCAATVGGKDYGIARGATIHSIKVIDDDGLSRISSLPAGLDWVMAQNLRPAVASISLQLLTTDATAVETWTNAIESTIAAGITVVVAAGNQNEDACTRSPSQIKEAITVGATTNTDARASFSNWGSCVDLFAPGKDIISASSSDDTGTSLMSGSSMAAPLVAGVAAILLQRKPDLTPNEVRDLILEAATKDALIDMQGSPNKMLFMSDAYLTSLPAFAPVSSPNPKSTEPNSHTGLIVGIILGALLLGIMLIGVVVYLCISRSSNGRQRFVAGKNAIGAANHFQNAPQWKPQEGRVKLDNVYRGESSIAHGQHAGQALGEPSQSPLQAPQAFRWPAHQQAATPLLQQSHAYQQGSTLPAPPQEAAPPQYWPAYGQDARQPTAVTQMPPPQQYHWPAHS